MEYVNTALRRKIRSGSGYEKYFERSSCQLFRFGKGDTFLTIRKMKEWAEKYARHASDITANEFSGMGLSKTVWAIHQFLYWHFQYRMDGVDQYLKSPGCSWATRSEGIDCKSYSIFASAILQNLGIKHYFRKVRQPNALWPVKGLDPALWSHVYVIVPKDQEKLGIISPGDYHVLDATVPHNKEVTYLETKEILMEKVSLPQYGMAAPGMGACQCKQKAAQVQRRPTRPTLRTEIPTYVPFGLRAALGEEAERFQEAYDKFQLFLADLVVNRGLPAASANLATERLKKFVIDGVEPTMLDLFAIPVEDAKGLGLTITAPLLTDINQLPPSSGIFKTSTAAKTGLFNKVAGAVPVAGQAASLISSIIPKKIYNKTFGAVFANGFNFKCWGATWNPKKAETEFNKDAQIVKARLQQVLTTPLSGIERAINDFWIWFYGIRSTQRNWLNTSAKDCTRDGLKILIGSHDGLAAQTELTIEQALTGAGHEIGDKGTVRKTYPPESHTGRHALTYNVPQYRVTINTQQQPATTSNRGNGQSTGRSGFTRGNSNSFVDRDGKLNLDNGGSNNTSMASFGYVAGGLLLAVALGTAYYNKDKKQV